MLPQPEPMPNREVYNQEREFCLQSDSRKQVDQGRELGVKVAFWNITSKYNVDSAEKLCPWPFERAFVSSDLRVVPCCMIANPDSYEISSGIKNETSFVDIWGGSEYSDFRNKHLNGEVPEVCKNCYVPRD